MPDILITLIVSRGQEPFTGPVIILFSHKNNIMHLYNLVPRSHSVTLKSEISISLPLGRVGAGGRGREREKGQALERSRKEGREVRGWKWTKIVCHAKNAASKKGVPKGSPAEKPVRAVARLVPWGLVFALSNINFSHS